MADIITDANTKVWWVPTISSTSAPTLTELNAGEALESYITPDGLGLEFATDEVDTTALDSDFDTRTAGRASVSGELVLKDQGRGNVPWSTFSGKPTGYIVVRRNEAASGAWANSDPVEVYTVQAGQRRPMAPAANEVAKFAVTLFHAAAVVYGTATT